MQVPSRIPTVSIPWRGETATCVDERQNGKTVFYRLRLFRNKRSTEEIRRSVFVVLAKMFVYAFDPDP